MFSAVKINTFIFAINLKHLTHYKQVNAINAVVFCLLPVAIDLVMTCMGGVSPQQKKRKEKKQTKKKKGLITANCATHWLIFLID